MAGRPSKITDEVLAYARELYKQHPGDGRERNRCLLARYPMGASTRHQVMKMAKPDESREASVRPEGPQQNEKLPAAPGTEPTGLAPPLTDPEQIRKANMSMYSAIRDDVEEYPKNRIAAGKEIDRLHDYFPQDSKDALTPEQECKQIQEKIDEMFGLGYTVTTTTTPEEKK